MKNHLLTLTFLALSAVSLLGQTPIETTIYFDFDQHQINTQNREIIKSFVEEVSSYTEYKIRIEGHTDQDGAEEYNVNLSRQRAESVSNLLRKIGVQDNHIQVTYKGEKNPIATANDLTAKSKNRRVFLTAEVVSYSTEEEMIQHLVHENENSYQVNTATEAMITTDKGTEIKIPEGAFTFKDGSPLASQDVKLVIKEAFEYLDMVDQSLYTQTEDELLETGGMVFISAEQDGQELMLSQGKVIELIFPKQEGKDGMELFTGMEDDEGIIWEPTGAEIPEIKPDFTCTIDLSILFESSYEDTSVVSLNLGAMPPYPHPKRKAYPPNTSTYSEDKYNELYQKYEEVMAAYRKDQATIPARLKVWKDEVKKRELILRLHKKK